MCEEPEESGCLVKDICWFKWIFCWFLWRLVGVTPLHVSDMRGGVQKFEWSARGAVSSGIRSHDKRKEFRPSKRVVPFYFYEFDKWPAVVGLITGNFMTDVSRTNAKKRLRLYLGTVYKTIETLVLMGTLICVGSSLMCKNTYREMKGKLYCIFSSIIIIDGLDY